MTAQQFTPSMQANAERLVSMAHTWTRATRKRDRMAFVIFPSSKPGRAYYSNERACTCPSYTHRLACSHVLACRLEAEEAREQATRPRVPYAVLFPANDEAF